MDVIALISGGKDSFFSLLHCIANGHRIIALANLHPPIPNSSPQITAQLPSDPFDFLVNGYNDELDSFMYQTVGHGLLPFYPNALNLPLYRYPITGSSVRQELSYKPPSPGVSDCMDETEDLIPLLRHILERHPTAKAISTGAILSTYQRTRIESVCNRLELISLSYLWQRKQEELLEEMDMIGLDARIVKVAAVGLDAEKWIWRNVTDLKNRKFLEGLQRKWGVHVAGEGGEYETIVIDGPGWRGKIEVDESEREIVDGGGGVGHAKILNAKFISREVEMEEQNCWVNTLKRPNLWDPEFKEILETLNEQRKGKGDSKQPQSIITPNGGDKIPSKSVERLGKVIFISNLTAASPATDDISQEMNDIMASLSETLTSYGTDFSRITSTTLLLRSMTSFAAVNKVYSSSFTTPNPPSRVCVSVGNGLPVCVNVMLSVVVDLAATGLEEDGRRKGLHVQGRSYWAPANIGPYSQSISVDGWTAIAGMIPLIPASMEVINTGIFQKEIEWQAVLALQHLWRVAKAFDVTAVLGCVAYVISDIGMDAAQRAWEQLWKGWKGEDGFRGLYGENRNGEYVYDEGSNTEDSLRPPLLIVSVEELPRSCGVEWAGIGLEPTWLEKMRRRHDENDDDHVVSSREKWGIQTGAEISTNGIVTSSKMWYGGWNNHKHIHVPSGNSGGGVSVLCFPLPDAVSETERINVLVKEAVMAVVGEEMGFTTGIVMAYIPTTTGTVGTFIEAWDMFVKQQGVRVAVQVIPVKQVWDCNGVAAGLGAVVRMCDSLRL